MKKYFGMVAEGETDLSPKSLKMLEARVRERKEGNFISIRVITSPPLMRKAGTERVRQNLWAATAVYTYAASGMRMSECFFPLI